MSRRDKVTEAVGGVISEHWAELRECRIGHQTLTYFFQQAVVQASGYVFPEDIMQGHDEGHKECFKSELDLISAMSVKLCNLFGVATELFSKNLTDLVVEFEGEPLEGTKTFSRRKDNAEQLIELLLQNTTDDFVSELVDTADRMDDAGFFDHLERIGEGADGDSEDSDEREEEDDDDDEASDDGSDEEASDEGSDEEASDDEEVPESEEDEVRVTKRRREDDSDDDLKEALALRRKL